MNTMTKLSKKNSWLLFKSSKFGKSLITYNSLYALLFLCIIYVIVFMIIPIIYQIYFSFVDYKFFGTNRFVGFDIFRRVLASGDFVRAFRNTLILGMYTLVFYFPIPLILALMLNELVFKKFKRIVQTIIVIPNFISWVVVAGLFVMVLSPVNGPVNELVKLLGGKPISFITNDKWFRSVIIIADIWKHSGYGTIIYLASISSIDPGLYEAAIVDGAQRFRQIWNITLPSLRPTILIVFLLQFSGIFGGYEQILIMYSPLVYTTGDVLGTYIYRLGLLGFKFSEASCISLFGSIISFTFFEVSNFFSQKITGRRLM